MNRPAPLPSGTPVRRQPRAPGSPDSAAARVSGRGAGARSRRRPRPACRRSARSACAPGCPTSTIGGKAVRTSWAMRLGQRLDQPVARRLDDRSGQTSKTGRVVDRPGEVVLDGRRLEVEDHLDVDVERLVCRAARRSRRRGGPGRPCRGGRSDRSRRHHGMPARTTASASRAARTFGRDVVDADEIDARPRRQGGRRERRLEPLVGGQVEHPPEGRLARRPEQDRPAEHAQLGQLRRRSSRLCSGVLPKPKPGSTISDSQRAAGRDARDRWPAAGRR